MSRRKQKIRSHQITDKNNLLFDEIDYERSCSSKVGYDTEWQAQYAIDEAELHGVFGLRFYFCNYCNKFHLTSNDIF